MYMCVCRRSTPHWPPRGRVWGLARREAAAGASPPPGPRPLLPLLLLAERERSGLGGAAVSRLLLLLLPLVRLLGLVSELRLELGAGDSVRCQLLKLVASSCSMRARSSSVASSSDAQLLELTGMPAALLLLLASRAATAGAADLAVSRCRFSVERAGEAAAPAAAPAAADSALG